MLIGRGAAPGFMRALWHHMGLVVERVVPVGVAAQRRSQMVTAPVAQCSSSEVAKKR
jgi:hypothetical protein